MKTHPLSIFSLRYRITFIVFILEIVLLSFVLTQTLAFIEKQAEEDMLERHNIYFELIKSMAQDSLFSGEFEDLQTFVEKIALDKEIINIIATTEQGIVVADSNLNRMGSVFLKSDGRIDHRWKREKIPGLGYLFVQFSLESQKKHIKSAQDLGFAIALPGIALIGIVSLLFGSLLTRRLNKLITAVKQFQTNGEMAGIEISGRDEVATLAKSFQFMRTEITKNVLKLQDEREKLEVRVFQRTKELHEAQALLIKSNQVLKIQSTTDRFTGLANRAFLEDSLSKEISRSRREKKPFGVILIDIDNFKTINDNFGHDGGDDIITLVVTVIIDSIRAIDLAGRWGGDEFLIVCPKVDLQSITEVANRIRLGIENRQTRKFDAITASLGVAIYKQNDSQKDIIKRSDLALYEAKNSGKNCVRVLD